jgi:tetratricopeptide (TPR) repeat protein
MFGRRLLLALGLLLAVGGLVVGWIVLARPPVPTTTTSAVATTAPVETAPGAAELRAGDLEGARARLEEHLKANPEDIEARYLLALVHERAGAYDDAMGVYEEVLSIDTRNFEAQFRIANILRRQGRLEQAKARYEESLLLNSDFTAARVALAETLAELGDADGAIELYFDVIEARPMGVHFDQIRVALARLLVEVDQSQNAALQLEKALAENPENAEAKEFLGELRSASTTPPPTETGATDGSTATTAAE